LLDYESDAITVRLTYDPSAPLYTISLTRSAPWETAPVFSLRFDGPHALAISTDRHELDTTGNTLSVQDTGFGNVLNGLQFNEIATAELGNLRVTFPLSGAAEPVAAFRACVPRAGV
jgi:hypothetical protein